MFYQFRALDATRYASSESFVYTVYVLAVWQREVSMVHVTVPGPQKVRKVGNSLVVTIPADFAEQHNIKAEDLVQLTLSPLEIVPRLRPELAQIAEEETSANLDALRYLRDN
jgi:antitoxin component of MazEF toxin-antitoxin module